MKDEASKNMKSASGTMRKYWKSCESEFWQNVFRVETDYLLKHLKGCQTVLSVGCGPAVIEAALGKHGYQVTGVDIEPGALRETSGTVKMVVARAEDLPFPAAAFEVVIFVTSLQFIEDYRAAVAQAARVLRENGQLIVMLLNPASAFFQRKRCQPHSYVHRIRHTDLEEIQSVISRQFEAQTEYFLGIDGATLFETREPAEAALFVIRGTRKAASL